MSVRGRSRVFVGTLLVFCFVAADAARAADPAPKPSGRRLATEDTSTKHGLDEVYNLEYDKAIADFEKTRKLYPEDPYALNHLLQARLLKELYRLNALDTTLYADNGFLTGKPLSGDPKVKEQIMTLADEGIRLADARLKANPRDVEMLYARGVTRGLRLSYVAIIEKSFFAALRNASASRADHEKVLEFDPTFTDAKLLVGTHLYVVGSLAWPVRIFAGVAGLSGNKKKGLEYLQEVADSKGEASTDARVAMALFLRREGRYADGLKVMRTLTPEYPKSFLFALEEANLLKDVGHGEEAIAAYRKIIQNAAAKMYPDPHLERAWFGLGECLKGQRRAEEALEAYQKTLEDPRTQTDVRLRALLFAGQMYDALEKRAEAEKEYRAVVQLDGESSQAATARRYLKEPYRYPK